MVVNGIQAICEYVSGMNLAVNLLTTIYGMNGIVSNDAVRVTLTFLFPVSFPANH